MRYNEVEVERVRDLLAETALLQRGSFSKVEIVVE